MKDESQPHVGNTTLGSTFLYDNLEIRAINIPFKTCYPFIYCLHSPHTNKHVLCMRLYKIPKKKTHPISPADS